MKRNSVHDRVMRVIRERVSAGAFVMTVHAEEEMSDDGLSISDVEEAVRCGGIKERQHDRETDESKYRIRGLGVGGRPVHLVVKLGPTDKVVIITVYAEEENSYGL